MGLKFYNQAMVEFTTDPLRGFCDGHLGGPHEQKFHVRNDDLTKYYTGITVVAQMQTGEEWGDFSQTGWSIRLLKGERRPTEAEWDLVLSGAPESLPDIGTVVAANTSTYSPVWVRIFCPGGEPAQFKEGLRLRLGYYIRLVGS